MSFVDILKKILPYSPKEQCKNLKSKVGTTAISVPAK